MTLHRLIYCSQPIDPSKAQIESILQASCRNNPRVHITGMLLFTSQRFTQLLEGNRQAINARFQKICQDTRHENVEILSYGAIDFRFFDCWSMHYVALDDTSRHDLQRYSEDADFDPYRMSPSAIEQLCLDFSIKAHSQAAGHDTAA